MDRDEVSGLIKRCARVIPDRERVCMDVARETALKFDKYMGSSANDLDYAKEFTGFVHRGRGDLNNTFVENELSFSGYDVFEKVLNGEFQTGDCLGLSQVGFYLLASRGMDILPVAQSRHIFLMMRYNNKLIPIETTTVNGYDHMEDGLSKVKNIDHLEASVLYSQGCVFSKDFENDLAIENYMKAVCLDEEFENAYYNMGNVWARKKKYPLAVANYTKAIDIYPDFENAFCNRAWAFYENGEYELALKDFEKYASFSEKNREDVIWDIRRLKIRNFFA